MKRKILSNIAAATLFIAGFVAFLFLAGDESPECPLTFAEFLLVKTAAMAALAAVAFAARGLYRRGLLPEWLTK